MYSFSRYRSDLTYIELHLFKTTTPSSEKQYKIVVVSNKKQGDYPSKPAQMTDPRAGFLQLYL